MDQRGSGSATAQWDGRRNSVMSIAFLASHGDAGLGTSRGIPSAVVMTNGGHGGPDLRSLAPTKPSPSVIPPLTLQVPTTDVDDEEEDDDFIGSAVTNRPSRSPRPSYTEEQKFFIMFARIIQDKAGSRSRATLRGSGARGRKVG
jgi:hypothetical protein